MRNVTITLPEDVALRARVEAAKEGKSLSKFVAGLIEARVGHQISQKEAAKRFLSGPLWPLSGEDGKLPGRAEMYDERTDQLFRGHERPAVSAGRKKSA